MVLLNSTIMGMMNWGWKRRYIIRVQRAIILINKPEKVNGEEKGKEMIMGFNKS